MPACDLRKEVQSIARMFEVTQFMVADEDWNPSSVLPTLQTQLWQRARTRWGRR